MKKILITILFIASLFSPLTSLLNASEETPITSLICNTFKRCVEVKSWYLSFETTKGTMFVYTYNFSNLRSREVMAVLRYSRPSHFIHPHFPIAVVVPPKMSATVRIESMVGPKIAHLSLEYHPKFRVGLNSFSSFMYRGMGEITLWTPYYENNDQWIIDKRMRRESVSYIKLQK